MRHLTCCGFALACALVATSAVAWTDQAQAQSTSAITAYIQRKAGDCSIYAYEENYRGALSSVAGPVTIATYTRESCHGGNNHWRTFGVFIVEHGRVRQFAYSASSMDDVVGVTVSGGRIHVRMLSYRPDDSRCCPTGSRRADFVIRNGRVSQIR